MVKDLELQEKLGAEMSNIQYSQGTIQAWIKTVRSGENLLLLCKTPQGELGGDCIVDRHTGVWMNGWRDLEKQVSRQIENELL